MAYGSEQDDVRQEVQYNAPLGYIVCWPKVGGANFLAEATSPIPTATVYKPDGTQVGSATCAHNVSAGYSRLTATITPSTWALDLGEHYRVDFTYADDTTTTLLYTESVRFDVMTVPFGTVQVSANDLIAEEPNINDRLTRQATFQGGAGSAANRAIEVIKLASNDVRMRLKRRVEEGGRSWPVVLFDSAAIRPVVVARALFHVYAADGVSTPEVAALADYWSNEADRRFAAMPDLQFSSTSDQVADGKLSGFAFSPMRRWWP